MATRSRPQWTPRDSRNPKEFHRFRVQGSVFEYKTGITPVPPAKPTHRGLVGGFSKAARLRLLKFVATIDWNTIPRSLFITLTYPDSYHERSRPKRGQDRQLFLRKLEAYLGRKVCGLWRIEWEPRKSGANKGLIMPHYHLLIFGVTYIPWQDLRQWWKDVLHHKGYLRTEVKRAGSPRLAGFYVSKYMSKAPDSSSLVNAAYLGANGRHYGYHRASLIPRFAEQWASDPSLDQVQQLLDYANDILPWLNKEHQSSYTLLGRYADHAKQILQMWGLTKEGV